MRVLWVLVFLFPFLACGRSRPITIQNDEIEGDSPPIQGPIQSKNDARGGDAVYIPPSHGSAGRMVLETFPDPTDFGTANLGAAVARVFYLRNEGNAEVPGLAIDVPRDPNSHQPSPIFQLLPPQGLPADTTPVCGPSLSVPPSGRCRFGVGFAPSVLAGTTTSIGYVATVGFGYSTSAGPVTADFTIRGSATVLPTLRTEIVNADGVKALRAGSWANVCVRVINPHSTLPLSNIVFSGLEVPFAEDQGSSCGESTCRALSGGVLAPGARCAFGIRFSPIEGGSFNSPVRVQYFNGVENKVTTTTVEGTALSRCELRESDEFTVFHNAVEGEAILRIPQDARFIDVRLKKVTMGGYVPELKLNGQPLALALGSQQGTQTLLVNLPFPVQAGENRVWGRLQQVLPGGPTSQVRQMKISLSGSYDTNGACGTY